MPRIAGVSGVKHRPRRGAGAGTGAAGGPWAYWISPIFRYVSLYISMVSAISSRAPSVSR